MRAPKWVLNLFANKGETVEQPPPIKYNSTTGLPSVQSTVQHHQWIASQSAPAIDRHSQDTWGGATHMPSSAERQAADTGHPAGSTFRGPDRRMDDRRAQRGYGAELRPLKFQPPTLWQPHPDAHRDHKDDPEPSWWRAEREGGRRDNDLGHPPGCSCTWCGG